MPSDATKSGDHQEQAGVVEAIPENLFREPIDFLFADHFRQRCICNALEELTTDPDDPARHRKARGILAYLEHDLPLHVADEEEDLFALLGQRCRREDELERITARLAAEHQHDDTYLAAIKFDLGRLTAQQALDNETEFIERVRAFVQAQRLHFAYENATLLPLARLRLTVRDKLQLGRSFAARRGAAYPE